MTAGHLQVINEGIHASVQDLKHFLEIPVLAVVGVRYFRCARLRIPIAHQPDLILMFRCGSQHKNVAEVVFIHGNDVVECGQVFGFQLTATMIKDDTIFRCIAQRPRIRLLTDVIVPGSAGVRHEPVGQVPVGDLLFEDAFGER